MTDPEHPNVVRIHEAYAAFGKGDLDRLRELFAEDVRWHEPGQNQLSGEFTGADEVFGMFGRLAAITEGTFRVEVRAAFADDTDGVGVLRLTASRGDRALDVLTAPVFRFEDGRIAEFWEANTDQAAMDAFYS
ncbi:nuclear transport factor 2 family protein [Geodermatophilus sp. SYSU D00804]